MKKVLVSLDGKNEEYVIAEMERTASSASQVIRMAILQARTSNQPQLQPQPMAEKPTAEKRGPGRPPKEKVTTPEPEVIPLPQTIEELAGILLATVTQAGAPIKEVDLVKPFVGIDNLLWTGARDLLWKQKKVIINGYPEVIWKLYVAPAPVAPVKQGW